MRYWASSLAIACLLLGCTKTGSDPTPGTASAGEPSAITPSGKPAPPADLYACSVDSDCALSGRVFEGRDACCVSPCGSKAVNAGVLEGFASDCEGKFELSQCVREHCAPPPPTLARCIDDVCTKVEGPVVMTNCEGDEDCALTDIEISGGNVCCTSCPDTAANANSLRGFKAWCAELPIDEPCPEAECAPRSPAPTCVEGQCEVRDEPTP